MSPGSNKWELGLTALDAYPAARGAVELLVGQVAKSLSDQLVGVYFDGSVALGDFDPARSDVDLVVLTEDPLAASIAAVLRELHADFARAISAWGEEVEVIYVSKGDLNEQSVLSGTRYHHVERGTGGLLRAGPLRLGWLIHLRVLAERGITIIGPDIRGIVVDVADETLRRSAGVGAEERHRVYRDNPQLLYSPGARAFAILTACRMLQTFQTGTVVPKMKAANATVRVIKPELADPIRSAMAWRKDDRDFAPPPEAVLRVFEGVRDLMTTGGGSIADGA